MQVSCISVLAGRIMASKETRFKSKISIQHGYCKVSTQRDRPSEHTRQQHPGLNVVKQVSQIFYPGKDHMIEKMKEKPTQPQKRKKTMDQMKHNLVVLLLLAKVQVEQIATEIQSADSVTSDTQQPEEPYRHRNKAAESESPNSEINVKLDAILNFSRNSQK